MRFTLLPLFLLLFGAHILVAQTPRAAARHVGEAILAKHGWGSTGHALMVDPVTQTLHYYTDGQLADTFEISTCKHGLRNRKGWQGTPTGLHRVKEKHGDGLPLNAILSSREYTGETARIYTDPTDVQDDVITTRILWLQGMEPGVNRGGDVDTYARYIYLHGTAEEGLLGTRASHGCIRLSNSDILHLYRNIPVGTLVYILPN